MTDKLEIGSIYVLVHKSDESARVTTQLMADIPMEAYALVAADLIRHISAAFGVSVAEVQARVLAELSAPTTPIITHERRLDA